jgi:hypothetical protein
MWSLSMRKILQMVDLSPPSRNLYTRLCAQR